MSQVSTGIAIQGKIEQVFDLVTTARYWPLWHPATVSVSGAIDQPMQLGDVIREHARIAGVEGEGDWTVVDYERPQRVVLHVPGTKVGDVDITYRFQQAADHVLFNRTLQFDASNFSDDLRQAIEHQMETDSIEGLRRLKALIEETLVKS